MERPNEKSGKIPTARDWLEDEPLTLSPDGDLLDAIDRLTARRVTAAPVVGHDRRLLGMLTEKDCLRLLSVTSFHTPRSGRVADFMSRQGAWIDPEDDPFEMAERFLQGNFPMLPVVEDGKLLGTISRHRMLNGILELVERFREIRKPSADIATEVNEGPRGIERMQKVFGAFSRDQLVRVLSRRRK